MEMTRLRRTRRPSVVWVDDQMDFLLEQVGHLNLRGFDVQPVDSVTGFLAAIKNQTVNIAIIDLKLGGKENGRELIDLIYENRPDIGIIVHSSFPETFVASLYDTERVCLVKKDPAANPVKPDDVWPLGDKLVELVDTLNGRQSGRKPFPVAMNSQEKGLPPLNWATVQRIREIAQAHTVITVIVLLMLVKLILLNPASGFTPSGVTEYLVEVSGFVIPFLVSMLLAWWFTPSEIREAPTSEAYVQANFEKLVSDQSLRASINRELASRNLGVDGDEVASLKKYFGVIVSRRVWLARVILVCFALGTLYLVYDFVRDIFHLFSAGHHG
ncbi:hypothetical protein BH10PSE14_BH10PSE14_37710 [soil metagenome]